MEEAKFENADNIRLKPGDFKDMKSHRRRYTAINVADPEIN